MNKIFALILISVALTGCGDANKFGASITGYSLVCVRGVSYIQFPSGASVQYDQAGNVVTCK